MYYNLQTKRLYFSIREFNANWRRKSNQPNQIKSLSKFNKQNISFYDVQVVKEKLGLATDIPTMNKDSLEGMNKLVSVDLILISKFLAIIL